jgi:hypothetical protein
MCQGYGKIEDEAREDEEARKEAEQRIKDAEEGPCAYCGKSYRGSSCPYCGASR